ncbi:zinc phosphodiesterase ELAC protein 2-like [Babylonia areolata]|uniref:zinc phosphodiesterase ELAC protein 2-like n=1 Tax=Babylonia areolata TaxID=304850 RepID=UPI003FD3E2C1
MSWLANCHVRNCRPITTAVLTFDWFVRHSSIVLTRTKSRTSAGRVHDLLFRMKKQDTPQLRHLKYRDKIGGKFPVPSVIDIQVVGSGGKGTPKSVLLTTDHSKYLFNCGEGTQRIATEFKMRLSKMENIFITHKNWDNIGGLLGMGLTLEGMKVPKVIIHGPPGVENVAMMAKGFAESTSMVVEKKPLSQESFEDSAFKIDYVPFCKKGFDPEKLQELLEERDTSEPEMKKQRRVPVENAVAVAYICWPHPPQRKIILEKCVDLGVEKGPVLGKLKNGESITLDNGTVVNPDQVLSDPEVMQPILIVDCPGEDYLESLLSNQTLSVHQVSENSEAAAPSLVIHMAPVQVFQTDRYQQWLNRFSSKTEHLVLNELTSDVAFEGVYRYQSRLHLVHGTIFPHLRHLPVEQWQTHCVGNGALGGKVEGLADKSGIMAGCTSLRFQYRPRKGFNRDQCIRLDHQAYLSEVMQQDDTEQVLKALHQQIQDAAYNSDQQETGGIITRQLDSQADQHDSGASCHVTEAGTKGTQSHQPQRSHPRLTFLGTGSSVPSKGRNVSGMVVHLSDDTTMILDCGEGTSGQLYRHYGDQTATILRKLRAVFVSHLHADHHMGLFSLLRDRKEALEAAGEEVRPTLLLAPIQIARWLRFYDSQVEPVQHLFKLKPLQDMLPHKLEIPQHDESYREVLQELSLTELLPVDVEHCPNAFGVALTHTDGWKLVFSGDTMPCQRLVAAGTDCDILVHEATHEDDLEEEAKMKRHSTTSQAIDIGQRMGAKFILLTHFSQRYAKIPIFSKAVPDNVGIAFDNMTVSMQELPLLPHFIPALKTLFAEEHADLEAKTLKRNKKKEFRERKKEKS